MKFSPTFMLAVVTLYAIALLCSMSAMEFLSWTAFAALAVRLTWGKVKWTDLRIHPVVEYSLLVFFAIGCLGLILNGTGEEQVKGIGSMRWIVLLYTFAYWFRDPALFRRAMQTLLIFGTVTALFALYQHESGVDLNFILGLHHTSSAEIAPFPGATVYQSQGFFGHHLKYGYSILFIFTLALAFALQYGWIRRARRGLILFAVVGVTGLSLVWTYGRGVWAAALGAGLVVAFCFGRRMILPALGTALACVVLTLSLSPGIRVRAQSVNRPDYASNSDRRDLWSANWLMFKEHPLFGVGILRNEDLTAEYYQKLGIQNSFVGHAHNTYINFLSMTGAPGLAAFLVFISAFAYFAVVLIRSTGLNAFERATVIGIFAGEIGFHVGGLTQCNFKDAVNNHLFIFLLAATGALYRRHRDRLGATKS